MHLPQTLPLCNKEKVRQVNSDPQLSIFLSFRIILGFKEAAILHAFSAASLTHHVSRACSRGALDRCSCDTSSDVETHRQQLKYGGCGDNIKYGMRFAKRFMQAGAAGKHSELHIHNSKVGIWVCHLIADGDYKKFWAAYLVVPSIYFFYRTVYVYCT